MLLFLKEYWGTIIVGIILLSIVAAIIVRLLQRKKSGKCIGCSSCDKCPSSTRCTGFNQKESLPANDQQKFERL